MIPARRHVKHAVARQNYGVWNAHDPDAVDRYVAEDVVIEAGGQEISGFELYHRLLAK
jgi:hypothetical protein